MCFPKVKLHLTRLDNKAPLPNTKIVLGEALMLTQHEGDKL